MPFRSADDRLAEMKKAPTQIAKRKYCSDDIKDGDLKVADKAGPLQIVDTSTWLLGKSAKLLERVNVCLLLLTLNQHVHHGVDVIGSSVARCSRDISMKDPTIQ